MERFRLAGMVAASVVIFGLILYMVWPRPVPDEELPRSPILARPTPTPTRSSGDNPGANLPAFEASASDTARVKETLSNTSLRVPDMTGRVSLRNATGTLTEGPTTAAVTLNNVLASRKTADGSFDAFADVSVSSGGSGSFRYIVLFRLTAQTIEDTSWVFVGDRVLPQSLAFSAETAQGYSATLTYLDRGLNEPMAAAPTVSKTVVYTVQAHKISK